MRKYSGNETSQCHFSAMSGINQPSSLFEYIAYIGKAQTSCIKGKIFGQQILPGGKRTHKDIDMY